MTITPDEQFILEHHREMVNNKRYGSIILKYDCGKFGFVKKEEILKPPSAKPKAGQPNG